MYKPDNPITQLAKYIEENLGKGYNLDALRYSLINQGYSKISVERAIERANEKIAEKIPPVKEKPRIIYKIIPEGSEDSEPIEVEPERKGFWKRLFG